MKRTLTTALALAFALVLITACGNKSGTGEAEGPTMTLKELLENPEPFTDKKIAVIGTVTHVCKHGGKRLHLTNTETNERLVVELGENMSAFARELEGSEIVVTGLLRETRIDEKYLDEWEQEILAEHEMQKSHGEECDPQDLDGVKAKREELAASGKTHLSRWHFESLSYAMKDGSAAPVAKDVPAEEEADHVH
jgi:hypothetical protein